jgi:hypothetical protein
VTRYQNHRLSAVSSSDQAAMAAELTPMVLTPNLVVQRQEEERRFAVFPESGLIALKRILTDGSVVGAAMVGREGMIGSPLGLVQVTAGDQAQVQMIGGGHRLPARRLAELSETHRTLRDALARYAEWQVEEARQLSACNALHRVEPRLAKWLLDCADRTGTGALTLTHEFISDMLGVQRTSVTMILRGLAQAGLIRTARARVEILDRAGLEALSCLCIGQVAARRAAHGVTKAAAGGALRR